MKRVALLAAVLIAVAVAWRARSHDGGEPRAVPPERASAPASAAPDTRLESTARSDSGGDPAVRETPSADAAPGAEPAAPFDDLLGCVVHGFVLDPSGKVAPGAPVVFVDAHGSRRDAHVLGEDGYSISGLSPGMWSVNFGADGHRAGRTTLDLDRRAGARRRDFVVEPAVRLAVKAVTPDGGPLWTRSTRAALERVPAIAGLIPVATRTPPGTWFKEVFGSPNNRFGVGRYRAGGEHAGDHLPALPDEYLGWLVLDVDPPVEVSLVFHHLVVATQRVEPGTSEVTFTLTLDELRSKLGRVAITLTDAALGSPIEGASVFLSLPGQFNRPRKTSAEGELVIDAVAPGDLDLWIQAKGLREFRRRIRVDPGRTTELALQLEPAARITGRVRDLSGQPVAVGISCGPADVAARTIDFPQDRQWGSESDGTFSIDGLGAGTHALRTTGRILDQEGACLTSVLTLVELQAGAEVAVDLVVETCRTVALDLRVADPTAGWNARVLDARGWPVRETRWPSSAPTPVLLPRGEYRLLVLDARGTIRAERAFRAEDAPTSVVVEVAD